LGPVRRLGWTKCHPGRFLFDDLMLIDIAEGSVIAGSLPGSKARVAIDWV
jgi:hypothetical protein